MSKNINFKSYGKKNPSSCRILTFPTALHLLFRNLSTTLFQKTSGDWKQVEFSHLPVKFFTLCFKEQNLRKESSVWCRTFLQRLKDGSKLLCQTIWTCHKVWKPPLSSPPTHGLIYEDLQVEPRWNILDCSPLSGQLVTVSAPHYSKNFCPGSAPPRGLMRK